MDTQLVARFDGFSGRGPSGGSHLTMLWAVQDSRYVSLAVLVTLL
jgi:hypothetical protein